ncbi:ATP12 family chaperone protein [Rhodalgimonas zhirmunskyi]|uniref:ATPase n=1 Tax=Rhodalgimonas zhirmunskyi TaxID=2964767 RepID=A0AAJ1U9R7_9RHOB|nr:ATP12 family protein [Rhodoalgimonas zhirmunskyi]MDQ2093858.1 ATPase [Rhodoalgimonas zhirmunskyi]
MSEWKAKRFWKEAAPIESDNGYEIHLDGRPVKTPAKAALVVPVRTLAEEIAAEWNAQPEQIDPLSMPFTRSANAALDKVARQHGEVADLLAAYGDSDMTCYRADAPETLVTRQAEAWDPVLDWAREAHGIVLEPVIGVMHRPQDEAALRRIRDITHAMTAFELTAFHDLVGLSGSFLLGLAAHDDFEPAETIWSRSTVDETWQQEQWGLDEEAAEMAAAKRAGFLHAARLAEILRSNR